ncbi:MAG: HD domain-containing protein [Dehalococcoidales bacterium]|nr:HD domain-containing protein [Dehalococcoidales bacterium]
MHDLGKVSIQDKILFKPDILTDEERAKMKEHAQKGYNLANRSKALSPIAGLILHHHEYWDGQGYPEGLQGEQIPLEDRLFSIMDAYDALTNIRPYRKGVSKQEALTELKSRSGTQFEPKLLAESIQYI